MADLMQNRMILNLHLKVRFHGKKANWLEQLIANTLTTNSIVNWKAKSQKLVIRLDF
jgi:hypothetical protein